jgi:hypothetical protein
VLPGRGGPTLCQSLCLRRGAGAQRRETAFVDLCVRRTGSVWLDAARTIRFGNAGGVTGFCRPAGAWAAGGPVNPGSRPGLSSVAPPALESGRPDNEWVAVGHRSHDPGNGSSLNRRFRRFRRWRGRNASTQGPCRCHLAGEGHARSKLLTICVIYAICGSNSRFQDDSTGIVHHPVAALFFAASRLRVRHRRHGVTSQDGRRGRRHPGSGVWEMRRVGARGLQQRFRHLANGLWQLLCRPGALTRRLLKPPRGGTRPTKGIGTRLLTGLREARRVQSRWRWSGQEG